MDGALMMVGIIIGIGIFKFPQLVASTSTAKPRSCMSVAGRRVRDPDRRAGLCGTRRGLSLDRRRISLPHAAPTAATSAFMFAWARTTVIQTGAIALVAFALGDYAQQIYSLGANGPAIYAAFALAALTLLNISGTSQSKTTQNLFSTALIARSLRHRHCRAFVYGGGAAPKPPSASAGRRAWPRHGVYPAHLRRLERGRLSVRRGARRQARHDPHPDDRHRDRDAARCSDQPRLSATRSGSTACAKPARSRPT